MDARSDRKLLRELADRQAITELIYLYCRGLDRMDEPRAIYHPDAREERGEGVFEGRAHDMIAAALKALRKRYVATQHFIGNILIELDGDLAWGESYFHAYHRLPDPPPGAPPRDDGEFVMAGRYLDRFERRDGVWKIAHRRMVNDWNHTRKVAEGYFERFPGAYRSRRVIADSRLC
ncbi:MAG: nuclear transport factor 2 family protein [Caulobacteraceae bacterium]|nr:nuclear transport factor 2 family protein [Caulobacteraceae bacterium]